VNRDICRCGFVIGKENEPLYLRTFVDSKEDNGLRFHYHVHTSLDVIDEKVNSVKKPFAPAASADLYLGLLFSVEDFKIYGYRSNTKIKFVAVLKDTPEANIKSWFRDLHNLFLTTMCNPFCTLKSKIESPKFDAEILKLVEGFQKRTPPISEK